MEQHFIWVSFVLIALLVGLLINQQHFYQKQITELVGRLMARSVTEYERAVNPPPPRVTIPKDEPVENFDRILG